MFNINTNMQEQYQSIEKFIRGGQARDAWSKPIITENTISIEQYNEICNNSFIKMGDIKLDSTDKRQSTLTVDADCNTRWSVKKEHIYAIVRDGLIMKIGGTRDGMKGRWGSYGCGYYVPQRSKKDGTAYPGKMSVTNAYLYHTIEKDLLYNDAKWEFWTWELPVIKLPVNILNENIDVIAQTFHAYESICIKKFKEVTGHIPLLCDNSDPNY